MEALSGFTTSECAEAVRIAITYHVNKGTLRPIPFRMRRLIESLNVNHFRGRDKTEELRREMCDRITKAVQPWLG